MAARTARADGWIGRLVIAVTSALAMVVLATPLALWVSWTEEMWRGGPRSRTISALDDRVTAELSNLNPMIYHNRLSAEGTLRNTLERVKRTLKEGEPAP
jgi:hypothetical protein